MTESEWQRSTTPTRMLEWVYGRVSDRKLRLYAAACCRARWDELSEESSRESVRTAELYVDRRVTVADLKSINSKAFDAARRTGCRVAEAAMLVSGPLDAPRLRRIAAHCALIDDADVAATGREWVRRRREQADLLREIIGNPFRQVHFTPPWVNRPDGPLTDIAAAIYEGNRFENFPALHDALLEAGCKDEEVLSHCRTHTPSNGTRHVRGCWVIDGLLKKE